MRCERSGERGRRRLVSISLASKWPRQHTLRPLLWSSVAWQLARRRKATDNADIGEGSVSRLELGLELIQALRARSIVSPIAFVPTRQDHQRTPLPVSVKTSLSDRASA